MKCVLKVDVRGCFESNGRAAERREGVTERWDGEGRGGQVWERLRRCEEEQGGVAGGVEGIGVPKGGRSDASGEGEQRRRGGTKPTKKLTQEKTLQERRGVMRPERGKK